MQFLDSESTVEIVETGSGRWEFPSGLRAWDSRRIAPLTKPARMVFRFAAALENTLLIQCCELIEQADRVVLEEILCAFRPIGNNGVNRKQNPAVFRATFVPLGLVIRGCQRPFRTPVSAPRASPGADASPCRNYSSSCCETNRLWNTPYFPLRLFVIVGI